MRAVIQTGYGSADVMQLAEVEKPTPGDGEVLVRVLAASLAAGEYFGMRGKPFPIRLYIGFPKPKKDFVVGIDGRDRWVEWRSSHRRWRDPKSRSGPALV